MNNTDTEESIVSLNEVISKNVLTLARLKMAII